MGYVIVILAAYLLGCSNMAVYLAKLKNVDLTKGSGNPGTSNATILMGWNAGVIVGIHDIGKAALAVILAELIFPDLKYVGAAAGVACILGHIFPFYMGFRGGKGFASYLGMTPCLKLEVCADHTDHCGDRNCGYGLYCGRHGDDGCVGAGGYGDSDPERHPGHYSLRSYRGDPLQAPGEFRPAAQWHRDRPAQRGKGKAPGKTMRKRDGGSRFVRHTKHETLCDRCRNTLYGREGGL